MKLTERYLWMAAVILLGIALFFKSCKQDMVPIWKKCPPVVKCAEVDTATSYVEVFDSLQKRIDFLEQNGKPFDKLRVTPKVKPAPDEVMFAFENAVAEVDTAAILKLHKSVADDYYSSKYYTLPYRDDSIDAVMKIRVYKNAAEKAELTYKLIFPVAHTSNLVTVTIDTTVVRGYGAALTFGGGIEAGANGLYFAGGGLGISTNKGSHFAVEYNAYKLLTGEDKYSFRVGWHQAIRFK